MKCKTFLWKQLCVYLFHCLEYPDDQDLVLIPLPHPKQYFITDILINIYTAIDVEQNLLSKFYAQTAIGQVSGS
jgi:hypothetical protein